MLFNNEVMEGTNITTFFPSNSHSRGKKFNFDLVTLGRSNKGTIDALLKCASELDLQVNL